MLRSEVQNKTGLTRKAIEYYEEKGLISPERSDNGYRNYSNNDVRTLEKISILSKVGLCLSEIKEILNSKDSSLSTILRRKDYEIDIEKKKKEILELIVNGEEKEKINEKIALLDSNQNIYQRLTDKFPGYFGQLLFLSYKPFLNEKLSDDGKEAFEKYIEYLDQLPVFELSNDEYDYIENLTKSFSMEDMEKINESKIEAVNNTKEWFRNNEKSISEYENYKKSDEYLNSKLKIIQDKLQRYMTENSYYEIAIPLIRKFSKSYDKYYNELMKANEKFLKSYDLRN